MIKKIFITNGNGRSGKDTFASMINKYIPSYKYSIIEKPKEAAKVLGWDSNTKTERDRKFLSDIMDLSSDYNDCPFRDVLSVAVDFKNDLIDTEVLLIDMRDTKDIARAVEVFGAETILIRNPNIKPIKTNHADANTENFQYDYIIENDGTLEQLDRVAQIFTENVIVGEHITTDKPLIFKCSDY